ncbi:MAG: class I SAM-dependent methyltransferase, partial [Mycobacterium sp.]|nr:class I SAM-dependent methyltransferase [Mycobacterium sp.]
MDFEALYGEPESGLIPWDIGGPQPVVQQLVAFGGLRGHVLDPGTGPGYHAIHFASKGYSTTGLDGSASAIQQAKRRAETAGVAVDFQVADATTLDGFEARFDTVVDSAFYHVFLDDEETQTRYVQALHRATRAGARLFMFEFGVHNVNGVQWEGLPSDNFQRVLSAGQWRMDYLGTSTYVARSAPQTLQ